MTVSVLILTLNEQINISDCIESVCWSDDIIVLDSFSTDETVKIAESSGARVFQRKFDNWSAHQNWAVKNLPFRHPWVLYIDADERCDIEMRDEVQTAADQHNECNAYRIRRKDFFLGTWLKHAQIYPSWFVRLFKPDKIRYERLVNPVAIVNGKTGSLRCHITHHPFSHGIGHWISRHNGYSDLEATELLKVRRGHGDREARLFARDPNERRRALKDVYFRIPLRPWVKFVYLYFFRRGFLDGRAGLTYARLQATYEMMIDLKVHEQVRKSRRLPI